MSNPVEVRVHVPQSPEKNPPQEQTSEIVAFFNEDRCKDMQPFLGFRLTKQEEFINVTEVQPLDGNHWTVKRAAYEQHFNQDIASPNWGKPENLFAAKVLQAMRQKNGQELPPEETDLFGYEVLYELRHQIGLSDDFLEKCNNHQLQQKLLDVAPIIDCALDIASAEILMRTNQTVPESMDERRTIFRRVYTDVPVLRSDIAGNIVGSMMAEYWTQHKDRKIIQMQKTLNVAADNLKTQRNAAVDLRKKNNELQTAQNPAIEVQTDDSAEVQTLRDELQTAREKITQLEAAQIAAQGDAEAARRQVTEALQNHGDDLDVINAKLAAVTQKLLASRKKGLTPQEIHEIIDAEYRFVDPLDYQKAPKDERAKKQQLLEKKEAELFAARDDYHLVIGRYETEEGVNVEIPYAHFVEAQKQAWIVWKDVNAELFSAVLPTNHEELYQSDQHYQELYDLMRPLVEGTYPEGDSFIYLVPRYIEGLRLLRRRLIEIDDGAFNNLYKKSVETIERYTEGKVADSVLEGFTVAEAEAQFGHITLKDILDEQKSIYDGSYITYVVSPGIYPSDSLKEEDATNGTQLVAAFETQTASVKIDLVNPGFQLKQNGGTEYQLQEAEQMGYGQTGALSPRYIDTLEAIDDYKDNRRKRRSNNKSKRK